MGIVKNTSDNNVVLTCYYHIGFRTISERIGMRKGGHSLRHSSAIASCFQMEIASAMVPDSKGFSRFTGFPS